jgi:DNA-binding transcriptional LysR family regulator
MRVDTLTSIRVFRQVVESGSFVAAADRMDLSTAMVSKHVAYVEKRLGVRLLNRNSRTLSLTEPGSVYFERCKTILDDLEATELELGSLGTVPRGTVRVTCPSWFARQLLADYLAEFRRRYPEIVVDISFEDRRVDLVEEGYDLALRVTPENSLPPGVIARPVRSVPFFIAASHEYLKSHGAPKSPEDLAHHDFVAVGNIDSLPFRGSEGKIEVPLRVVMRYRSIGGVGHGQTSSSKSRCSRGS